MSSLMLPMLLGLVAGSGVGMILFGLTRRRLPLGLALEALAEPRLMQGDAVIGARGARIVGSLTPAPSREFRSDLAVIGRSEQAHAVDKLRTTCFWVVLPTVAAALWRTAGVGVDPVLVALSVPALGVGGWFLSDQQVRTKARTRRREFRSTLISYLQLVTILLAGGAGVNQALHEAAAYGHGWSFEVVQRALRDSQSRNESPWDGFARVAEELTLPPLLALSASMRLAGESGAHVRDGLLAKCESLRVHELTEIEAEAASASEKMGGPVGAMVIGFVIAMGYPAFAAILAI